MTYTSASKLTAALVAFVMVTAPMSVLASHNSIGADVQVAQATEFNRTGDNVGEIEADVPEKMRIEYHGGSADQGLIDAPRKAPQDQRGTAYSSDECRTYGEDPVGYEEENQRVNETTRQLGDVLTNPENRTATSNCYVGYFDLRHQYLIFSTFLSQPQGSDILYQANPEPGDTYCTGEKNPSEHAGPSVDDGGPVDSAIASANRSAFDDGCDGSAHQTYTVGYQTSSIDTTLLEAPFQSEQRTSVGLTDVTGTEEGSGTLTLPFMLTRYVYLFGQPHPAVDADDIQGVDKRYTAGEGPFGGDPIRDTSGACGGPQKIDGEANPNRRTKECKLLTPQDIRAYDDDPPTGEEDTARLCTYQPSYFSVNPGALTSGACGALTGTAIGGNYLPTQQAGGLGTDTGVPTWATLLPGWHGVPILVNHRSTTTVFDYACDGQSYCHDFLEDGEQYRDYGAGYFAAVNPEVPDLSDSETQDLWCVRPNILTTGPEKFYADHENAVYDADAIDSDRHAHVLDAQFRQVRDAVHDPIRDVLRPIQDPLPHHTEFFNPSNLNNPGNIVTYDQIKETVKDNASDQRIKDAIERADYVGTGSEETGFNETDPFDFQRPAGLGCTADGVVVDRATPQTVYGDFRFDTNVVRQGTVTLKDPTLLDDNKTARENETQPGTWQGDRYDFSGSAIAQVDTSDDPGDEFSACTEALGEPQPERDFCVWFAAWDAYNDDNCIAEEAQNESEDDRTCGDQLDDRGYDIDTGVGLIVTLETTGPTLLIDEELSNPDTIQDRTTLIGDTEPTARNCVVGTSVGLNEKIGNFTPLVDGLPDSNNLFGLAGELCDSDTQPVILNDAFEDGSPGPDGNFGGAFDFVKFAPTPDAARDGATNGFGEGDQICVHGIWSVKPGETASDTEGNMDLTGGTDGEVYHYKDCDPLTSGPNEGDR